MNSIITIVTFIVFVAIFLWIGALAANASDNTETDYLLGNRSFGKVFIGLSAGATGNSGWIMVGAVGMAYTTGISALLMVIHCTPEKTHELLSFNRDDVGWTNHRDHLARCRIQRYSVRNCSGFCGGIVGA